MVCINNLVRISSNVIPDLINMASGLILVMPYCSDVKIRKSGVPRKGILVRVAGVQRYALIPFEVNQSEQAVIFTIIDAEGLESKEVIHYRYKPSNLGIGQVPYFVCPYMHNLCRKLYLVDSSLLSRSAFRHYYRIQHLSHPQRLWNIFYKESSLKNRKLYYRGILTPFGYKVMKEKYQSEQAYRELLFAIAGSLKSRSGRAGRSKNAGR